MKFFPRNIRFRIGSARGREVFLRACLCAVCLLTVFGVVAAAAEEDPTSSENESLTGQMVSFASPSEPENIVVSGNNSFLVHLKVDGCEITQCYDKGGEDTVLDLLYRNDVYLNEDDEINVDTSEALEADLSVKVGRVTYKEVTERVSIPYKTTQILMSYSLSPALHGTYASRLKNTSGTPGIKEVTKRVKMVDGVVVESTTVSSKVISKAKDAVTYVDASYLLNLGNGAPSNYVKAVDVKYTAYTYGDGGTSKTATGERVRVGYVAVDRSFIPLHSYLYAVLDNGFVYGYCYAKDTGVKGNSVDLFLPSETDCYYFGRRTGKVYILSYGS